jgi:hypothetical protein
MLGYLISDKPLYLEEIHVLEGGFGYKKHGTM